MKKSLISLFLLSLCFSTLGKGKFLPSTFEAKFVKKEKSVLSGKILKAEGVLYYKYPSRIRLEEKGREKSIFVSNPFKTFYYKPPQFEGIPGELTVNSSNNYPLSKFFDSLNEGLKNNEFFRVAKGKQKAMLSFTKKGIQELKIKNATLGFSAGVVFKKLNQVEITLNSGKTLKFELAQIEVNKKLKKELFSFTPPKDTNISR